MCPYGLKTCTIFVPLPFPDSTRVSALPDAPDPRPELLVATCVPVKRLGRFFFQIAVDFYGGHAEIEIRWIWSVWEGANSC